MVLPSFGVSEVATMSLALLHQQCTAELNEVGHEPSAMEKEKEQEQDHELELEQEKASNQTSPPLPVARSCSTTTSTTAISPPSWLLTTLADLDERVKLLATNNPEEDDGGESFAERAESYYQKRPQLLSLLQDLYKAYMSLSDRYLQTLSKKNRARHSRTSSQISAITDATDYHCHDSNENEKEHIDFSSDAESSVSYQPPLSLTNNVSSGIFDIDALVAEVVMKNVECNILSHEFHAADGRGHDSAKKIELQRSLLEVLESERLILLSENARLGYKVAALAKENRELMSECLFVKREASELARCLLRMREEQRMSGLARKVEDLQGQICKLERRNREYYEQLVKAKTENEKAKEITMEACLQKEKLRVKPSAPSGKFGWWGRVKKMDLFMCGLYSDSS